MSRRRRMYYLDANISIFPQLYDMKIECVARAKEYLAALAEKEIEGCTSTLTWDEVVYIVRKLCGVKESLVAGRRFFAFPNLEIVDVDLEVLSMAQEIIESYNVKPRDAIHAACALKYCSGQIITSDPDFDVIREIRRKF